MLNKLFLLTVIALFSNGSLLAKQERVIFKHGKKELKQGIPKPKVPLSYERIKKRLVAWNNSIINGDANRHFQLTAMDYQVFSSHVAQWLNDPDLELNTGITKSWFIKLQAIFDQMAKIKIYLEHAKMDGKLANQAEVAKKRQLFIVAYKQFRALAKSPTRVSKKRLAQLRLAKKRRLMLQKLRQGR